MGTFDGLASPSLGLENLRKRNREKGLKKMRKRAEEVHLMQKRLQPVLTPSPGVQRNRKKKPLAGTSGKTNAAGTRRHGLQQLKTPNCRSFEGETVNRLCNLKTTAVCTGFTRQILRIKHVYGED